MGLVGGPLAILLKHAQEELSLVFGVEKERSRADAGAARDLAGGCAVKALLREEDTSGAADALELCLLVALAESNDRPAV